MCAVQHVRLLPCADTPGGWVVNEVCDPLTRSLTALDIGDVLLGGPPRGCAGLTWAPPPPQLPPNPPSLPAADTHDDDDGVQAKVRCSSGACVLFAHQAVCADRDMQRMECAVIAPCVCYSVFWPHLLSGVLLNVGCVRLGSLGSGG